MIQLLLSNVFTPQYSSTELMLLATSKPHLILAITQGHIYDN